MLELNSTVKARLAQVNEALSTASFPPVLDFGGAVDLSQAGPPRCHSSSYIYAHPTADMAGIVADVPAHNSLVFLGENVKSNGLTISVIGDGNVVYVGKNTQCNASILIEGAGCTVYIGDSVIFESGIVMCGTDRQHVLIGEGCLISRDVEMATHDAHSIFDRDSHEKINADRSIVVDRHVRLEDSVRLNKGSRVGTGCVVTQSSFVDGNLEPNCLYSGEPAIKCHQNIIWSKDIQNKISSEYR